MRNELFSLWLMFPQALSNRLRARMEALASILGSPRFDPHITLASELGWEDILRFEKMAQALTLELGDDASIGFERLTFDTAYFQSAYFALSLPPALRKLRSEAFDFRGVVPGFPPHVSLAYGVSGKDVNTPLFREIDQEFAGLKTPIGSLAVAASSERRPVSDWRILRVSLPAGGQ